VTIDFPKTLPVDSEKSNREDMITLVRNIVSASKHYFRYWISDKEENASDFCGGPALLFTITEK